MAQCPFHPSSIKSKMGLISTFLFKCRSWLDGLYERSYKMSVGHIKMPNLDLYVINDPKEVKRIMIDEVKEFPKSDFLHELLKPLLGVSIFTTNGDVWRKQRNLLMPSFEITRINTIFDLMSQVASDMMERLKNSAKQGMVEIDEHMTFVTADVIFRIIMSKKLDEKQGREVLNAFVIFQEETANTAIKQFFRIPGWISFIFGEAKRKKLAR